MGDFRVGLRGICSCPPPLTNPNRGRLAVWRGGGWRGEGGVMKCSGVTVLVANLATQFPELVRVSAVKALA